ncbi:hypothetical protein IWX90DRAFT_89111 [Phyllosticta citrichinensis]|uniref:Uncharacterized protein n=1 Tax=Phyllosticta citrichinensis TaxID=1130410 RepID=A0ABR1XFG5_9PEZI
MVAHSAWVPPLIPPSALRDLTYRLRRAAQMPRITYQGPLCETSFRLASCLSAPMNNSPLPSYDCASASLRTSALHSGPARFTQDQRASLRTSALHSGPARFTQDQRASLRTSAQASLGIRRIICWGLCMFSAHHSLFYRLLRLLRLKRWRGRRQPPGAFRNNERLRPLVYSTRCLRFLAVLCLAAVAANSARSRSHRRPLRKPNHFRAKIDCVNCAPFLSRTATSLAPWMLLGRTDCSSTGSVW